MHLDIVVAVEFFSENDHTELRTLIHKVITLLDGEIFNKARFDIMLDAPVELGTGIAASVISFDVINY